MKLHLLLTLLMPIIGANALCPSSQPLDPCTCDEKLQSITCDSVNGTDDYMRSIFKRSLKTNDILKFKLFHLKNCFNKKFGSDWFGAKPSLFVFKKIVIENCQQMAEFAHGAIGKQNTYIKDIVIKNTPIGNNHEIEEVDQMDMNFGRDPFGYNDIFGGLMTVPSLVNIDLSGTQLDRIPDQAFMANRANSGEWMAKSLKFCSAGEKCQSIKSVGQRAFFYFVHLEVLDLSRHVIDKIARHAFVRINQRGLPTKKLAIHLDDNRLTKDSFDDESLAYLHPRVEVNLSLGYNKNLTVIRETVFRRFLKTNNVNNVNVTGCPIDWKNNEMKWVDSLEPKMKSRIIR